jgi:hypothetical protein
MLASQASTPSVDDDRCLLDSTVMGDETWHFQYDPLTKRENMEWARQALKDTQNVNW